MSEQLDVHKINKRTENALKQIQQECSEATFELVNRYRDYMVVESLANATISKHLAVILNLSRFLKCEWENVTKEDVIRLVTEIMKKYSSNGQETHTTWDHKKILKIFLRWVRFGSRSFKQVGDPPETTEIRVRKVDNKISREDLFTKEDERKMINATIHPRNKALIASHSEAGTRPGEILNLKIKHVMFDDRSAVIKVDGKTGARQIRIVRNITYLANWINIHPFKNNPEAWLWCKLVPKRDEPLGYNGADKIFKSAAKEAGMQKRVYMHKFRHSEATDMAQFMTEPQMRIRHGWTSTSAMPDVYTHMNNDDVDNALFKHYGIKKIEQETENLPKICPTCKTANSPDSEFCQNCGRPTDIHTIINMEEKEKEIQRYADERLQQALAYMADKMKKLEEKVGKLE